MNLYHAVYIELNIFCSTIILLFLLHSFVGLGTNITQRRFIPAMLSLIVFYLSDTMWQVMDENIIPKNIAISILLKSIYFLSASSNGYFWLRYFETVLNSQLVKKLKNLVLLAIPFLVHLILCLVNVKFQILFYLDSDLNYQRGFLFLVQYFIIYLYILTPCVHAFILSFRKENSIDRDKLLLIAFFPIFPAIGGIIQYFFPKLPTNCIYLTFSSAMIYLDALTRQISLEPLTGLNNKRTFMKITEQYIQNNPTDGFLYLMMIDMNRFKSINDNYGHIEGDNAICTVADIIKASTNQLLKDSPTDIKKKILAARYGGDEFVVTMIAEEEDALYLKALINSSLKEYNNSSQKPYTLSASIGIAKWDPEYDSIKQWIEIADQELYKEKQATR